MLAAAVGSGSRLRRPELRRVTTLGREAAGIGVPLRALLGTCLDGAWQLWPQLPEVRQGASGSAEPVVRAGEVMLRGVTDLTAALIEGYQLARRDLVRAHGSARREFVDDLLLGGSHSVAQLVARGEEFGLTLVGPHAVAVVAAERPFSDDSPLTAVLERTLLGSKADADALVATKNDRLVVVFAAPDRAAVAFVVDRLAGALPDPAGQVRVRRTAAVGTWRIGVGRPAAGPAGVRQSYEEAGQALDLGPRAGSAGPVFDAADLVVQRVLMRDQEAIRELVDTLLAPLGRARGGAEPLIATLEAYFAAGGNATAAARALHLSVRALTYRLDRIATLTGRDPANPADGFALQTAVTGARLLAADIVPGA